MTKTIGFFVLLNKKLSVFCLVSCKKQKAYIQNLTSIFVHKLAKNMILMYTINSIKRRNFYVVFKARHNAGICNFANFYLANFHIFGVAAARICPRLCGI